MIADLKKYDQKYVLIKDIYGETHIGLARYENADFLECEWGGEGDGLFIEDFLIYNDQIASIEETVVHGTAELWTEQLILRKARPEDASGTGSGILALFRMEPVRDPGNGTGDGAQVYRRLWGRTFLFLDHGCR